MSLRNLLPRFGLALIPLLALPLAAQDWSNASMDFKLRSGATFGGMRRDLGDNKAFGFAIAGNVPLKDGHAITFELGYDYLPGRNLDVTTYPSTVYYQQTPGGPIISQAADNNPDVPGEMAPLQLYPNNSEITQKKHAEGFSARVAYVSPLAEGWAWQGGITLDRYKSTNEFVGTLVPMLRGYDNADAQWGLYKYGTDFAGGNDDNTRYEGWANSVQRATLNVGAYAGLIYQLAPEHKLELNLRNVGYGGMTFTPLAFSGQPEAFHTINRRGFVLELVLTVTM